jgi:hypothetical protein
VRERERVRGIRGDASLDRLESHGHGSARERTAKSASYIGFSDGRADTCDEQPSYHSRYRHAANAVSA